MPHGVSIPGLPEPRTALIGRERDLDSAHSVLRQESARLLTLTGVGGCGKTRLALQLMAELAAFYPQRIWAVELAAVVDPELIPLVVADALGLQESSTSSLTALGAYIAGWPALLLLDNCEHLIDACAVFVDSLLTLCPQLRVLATSREPLHIAGERQLRVAPLALPGTVDHDALAEIAASAAVQLFIARTQDVDQVFALTRDNAPTVARICTRLGGIPLALELAAARVRVLGLEQIEARLDDNFQLLSGGNRVAPTRHQTLRATLAWSDALLSAAERAVFRRLALFAGEFQLRAAEALCAGLDDLHHGVLDIVTGLVDKSLIVVESGDRSAWYRLLEPVRQYAFNQLEAVDEVEATRGRYAAFYLELAERGKEELFGPEQEYWLNRFEREHGNFRAVLEWARREADPTSELRLTTALEPYWNLRGHVVEGLRNLQHALARDGAESDPALRALALICAGRLSFLFEHTRDSAYAESEAYSREGLEIARAIEDARLVAAALTNLGMVHRMQRELDRSMAALDEALAIFDDQQYAFGIAFAMLNLGIGALIQGDHERGTRLLQESMERQLAIGNLRFAVMAQALLGWQARDVDEALEMLLDALPVHQRLGDRWFVTWDLLALADVVLAAGHAEPGVRLMGAAQAQSDRLGSPVGGVSFERALARVDSLRDEDWFEAVWAEGYALDQDAAVQLGLALPGDLAAREAPAPATGPGFAPLTPRELEVARLLAEGYTDREIADALFIAIGTVGVHVHNILRKLELQSRVLVAGWLAERDTASAAGG